MSVITTIKDFQPINTWKPDGEYLIDCTTGNRYWNESKTVVGIKAGLLTIGTPFIHAIAAVLNVAYRILKSITGYQFWCEKEGERAYDLNSRLTDAGQDLLRIIAAPLVCVGLELAALYGIVNPYDGRKLYASLERCEYGSFILAPCFQPTPKYHLLGGVEIAGAKF